MPDLSVEKLQLFLLVVSTFPVAQEIYVQEVWRVDESGKFIEMVPGTMGMFIRMDQCERFEFLAVEGDSRNG